MKKLFLLLILSLFSAQSFAGSCPDGSEPVKSVSDDGTYFVFNCGGGNKQSSSSTANSSNVNSNTKALAPSNELAASPTFLIGSRGLTSSILAVSYQHIGEPEFQLRLSSKTYSF